MQAFFIYLSTIKTTEENFNVDTEITEIMMKILSNAYKNKYRRIKSVENRSEIAKS